MRKATRYSGQTATYGMYIQSTIMKGTAKILARPAKVKTDDNEVDKMLLGKELLKWLH